MDALVHSLHPLEQGMQVVPDRKYSSTQLEQEDTAVQFSQGLTHSRQLPLSR